MNDQTPAPTESAPPVPVSVNLGKFKLDVWKLALVVSGVLNVLGGTSQIPPVVGQPAAAPAPDVQFQSDVRASLEKISDTVADIRERVARLEGKAEAQR